MRAVNLVRRLLWFVVDSFWIYLSLLNIETGEDKERNVTKGWLMQKDGLCAHSKWLTL